MKRKALPFGFYPLDLVPTLGAGGTRLLLRLLAALESAIPPAAALTGFLRLHQPDVVVVSPLVDAASDQVDLVKAARALGIPSAAAIASWDNLTNKGLLRVQPDRVLVWNEAQRAEAVEFHSVQADRVVVTGAQLFDRWFERRASTTHAEFCRRAGLGSDRPFVLFTCSSSFISLSHAELPFVRQWIAAVRANPVLSEMPIVVRPHPYNFAAWETADFSDLEDVVVWPARPYNPVEEASRDGFFDSLYHSAAVVGINTSAMIEAAILGRPVLSIVAGPFAATQEGTLHFHHLLPENGGFLRVASTLGEHVGQLAGVVQHPEAARAETQRFVASFIRPHGVDTPCVPRVADAIVSAPLAGVTASDPAWWSPALRPVLLAGSTYAAACWLIAEPKARRSARKKAGAALARGRKVAARSVRIGVDRIVRAVRRRAKQASRSLKFSSARSR